MANSLSARGLGVGWRFDGGIFLDKRLAAASLAVVVEVTAAAAVMILASASATAFLLSATLAWMAARPAPDWASGKLSAEIASHGAIGCLSGRPGLTVGRVPQFDQVVGAGGGELRRVAADGQAPSTAAP